MKVKEGVVILDGMIKGEFKVLVVVIYLDGIIDEVDVIVIIKEFEVEKNVFLYKDIMVVLGKLVELILSYGEGKIVLNGIEYKIDENFKVLDGYKVDIDKVIGIVIVIVLEKLDGIIVEEIEVLVIVIYLDKLEDKVIVKF